MIFVCNTGPLIALAKLDRLALLQYLGGASVLIPPMVYKELWGKIGPEAPFSTVVFWVARGKPSPWHNY